MSKARRWITCAAIAGNVLYVLWIVYNGIDDGFRAGPVEVVALSGLLVLLVLNVALLWRRGS